MLYNLLEMMKKLIGIDLFSGAGGLSEGILESGKVDLIAHVEWEKPMVKVLRERLTQKWGYSVEQAKEKVVHFDIQQTDELLNGITDENSPYRETNSEILAKQGLKGIIGNSKVDIIVGGPPCQAYSVAGRAQDKEGMKNDYRNYLFISFSKVVSELQPKVFVFENVPGILSTKPNGVNVTEEIYSAFDAIGYEILSPSELKNAIFNTAEYEVPQQRRRVVIFGVKKNSGIVLNELYDTLRSFASTHRLTVKDAIGNLPPIYPIEKIYKTGNKNVSHQIVNTNISNHVARYVSIKNQIIFSDWVKNGLNSLSTDEQNEYYFRQTGHKTNHPKYRSLEWDKPSPTVVAHLYKDGYMFIHPDAEQKRSITVREAANLMTFPEDFNFNVSDSYAYKMIGNAVPVNFAKFIGLTLAKVLSK